MKYLLFALMIVAWLLYVWVRRPRIRKDVARSMDAKFRAESADSPVTYTVPETLEGLQVRYWTHRDLRKFRQHRGG
jgi:hypothetical protein